MKAFKAFITILIMVLVVVICYYTGNLVQDTSVMIWPFKLLSVFLGGMLWVGVGFIIIILSKIYISIMEFIN